ncbi:hypothetical protein CJO80_27150 (plasmid) [Ralstonia solanacearum]|nr:hypothetical protein CJO80_27150 [Ralstonia solanacearum]
MDTTRPQQHLIAAANIYPGAWRRVDEIRAGRGKQYPDWESWCFFPLAGAAAIVADAAGVDVSMLPHFHPARVDDAARLGALATWRVTQGIYRFDPALYPALIDTPLDGSIPHDVLYRLPQWCVYIETPGLTANGLPLLGAFAHLDHDHQTGRPELRLLLDQEYALTPLPIHLGDWPLQEALDRMSQEAGRQAAHHGLGTVAPERTRLANLAAEIAPLLTLLLYLCAAPDEIGAPDRRPTNPAPKRTKTGWRMFPADRLTTWDVGARVGAALRLAYHASETASGGDGSHAGPRPHIRRAHWHGFRSGPRKREDGSEIPAVSRRFDLRWLPPIPVNAELGDELPAVIRTVKP